ISSSSRNRSPMTVPIRFFAPDTAPRYHRSRAPCGPGRATAPRLHLRCHVSGACALQWCHMADDAPLTGPDLKLGIAKTELGDTPLVGHADGERVLLVRDGERIRAVGASCTHYGGPLAEGIVAAGEIRCPWHHAA